MKPLTAILGIVARRTAITCRQAGLGVHFPFAAAMRPLAAFIRNKNLMMNFFISIGALVICYCAVAAPAVLQTNDCELAVGWNIVQDGSANSRNSFTCELILTNTGSRTLGGGGWQLYFNFCRKIIPESVSETVHIVHENGDLFRLEPSSKFVPLHPGASRTFRFKTDFWVIKESDAPSGCYLVMEDGLGRGKTIVAIDHVTVGPIVTKQQTMRTPNDQVTVPTPNSRYLANLALRQSTVPQFDGIVPSPVVFKSQRDTIVLDRETVIYAPKQLESEAEYLADALELLLGAKLRISKEMPESDKIIVLSVSDLLVDSKKKTFGEHAYRLGAQENTGVAIVGTDPTGVFYGIQSLRSLLPINVYRQPSDEISFRAVEIEDAPRFRYRGLHLDVARNFHKPSSVKKLLELMAFYKLNKFHFHLTDDEGWRLEIAGLPELTEVGGRRSHAENGEQSLPPSFGSGPYAESEGSYGNGYYSRQDFIDILQYAAERHIEVIPEIDLPGHARAAIKAMEVRHKRLLSKGLDREAHQFLLNNSRDDSEYESVQMWNDNVIDVCQDSTFAFIRHVITDIKSMYAEAGITLSTMHLGGDEVPQGAWQKSSTCQQLPDAVDSGKVSTEKEVMGHFFEKIADVLATEDIIMAAWEEAFLGDGKEARSARGMSRNRFVGPNFQCHVWNNVWGWGQEDVAYRLANAGVNVVLCNATHLYFDLAYNKDPKESGYYWAGFVDTKASYSFAPMNYLTRTRKNHLGQDISQDTVEQYVQLIETGEKHILGIQGQLWGENLKGEKRLEYMALPKLIALAERAWARQPEWARESDQQTWPSKLEQTWSEFANRLGARELPRLDYLEGGFHYRIPGVGAVIEDGVLKSNVAFPGLTIRYTADGSEPNVDSPVYTKPVQVGNFVRVRAFNSVGRGGLSSEIHERTSP
jgi:hexosaminidase